jgi:hypothetical protein
LTTMKRIRTICLALVAVFAMSAIVATASASAACSKEGGDVSLCIEGREAKENSTFKFTSVKKPGTVSELKIPAIGLTITCKKAVNTGGFETFGDSVNPEVSDVKITFSECEVTDPAQCEVPTIKVEGENKDGLDAVFAGAGKLTFFSSEKRGGTFVLVTIKSKKGQKCPFESKGAAVTGEQECSLPGGEVEAVTHELECTAAGSKLAFAGLAATFSLQEEVKLTTGKKWSIIEG